MVSLEEILTSYWDIILAVIFIIVSVVAAKIITFIIKKQVDRLTAKTSTILDDLLIKAISRPVFIAIILAGVYFALKTLNMLVMYANEINMGFTVIYILFGAWVAVRIVNAILEWYAREMAAKTKTKADEQFLPIFRKVAYAIVFVLALLWILNQFGIEITTLVAALGIGGLAIAFAMQDTLKQFFAGAYMVIDRPIRIGDYIELDSGEKGYVEDIGWRSTRIRVLGNNMVIIPNSKISESRITNYYAPIEEMSVVVKCGVSYESDLDKVERVTIQVAKRILEKIEGGKRGFEPFVRFNEFGDSNINFSIILRVNKYVDKYMITHEFIKALKKRYDKEDIEIAWPVRKIYYGKEQTVSKKTRKKKKK